MIYIATIGQVLITVVAITTLAVRLEHRLTKIENDMQWVKKTLGKNFNGDT